MKNADKAIHQACSNAIHREPHLVGSSVSLLKRIVALESKVGVESPELVEAKSICDQLDKADEEAAAKAAAEKK